MCRRSLSSPSAFTVRETALAALGAAAVTRIGAPTKPLDLDAERASRFCEWIGEVENGKGGQGYVASGDRGGTRGGVRTASKKTLRPQIALAFPGRWEDAAPETAWEWRWTRVRCSPARRRR